MKDLKNYIFESGSEASDIRKPEIGSTLYVVHEYDGNTGKAIKVKVKSVVNGVNFANTPFIFIEFEKEASGIKGYGVPASNWNNGKKDSETPEMYYHVYTDFISQEHFQVATSLKWLEEYNNIYYNSKIQEIDNEIGKLNKQISDIQEKINKKNEEKAKIMSEMYKYEEENK